MKKLLTLLAILIAFTASAQTDSVVYLNELAVYQVDTSIIYGDDTITTTGNIVKQYYHYVETRGDSFCYQPQFVIYSSAGVKLLPNVDLSGNGWRSSGTVKEFTIGATDAAKTPEQLRDLFILPDLKSVYGSANVTKL